MPSINRTMDTLQAETIMRYTFNDSSLLAEALTAAGLAHLSPRGEWSQDGNKRLAVIGDTVLQLALAEEWYEGNTERGHFSRRLQEVASNANLDLVGRKHALHECVRVNPSQGRTVSPTTMAATVEAILGAVYLDSARDLDAVRGVMRALGLGFL